MGLITFKFYCIMSQKRLNYIIKNKKQKVYILQKL